MSFTFPFLLFAISEEFISPLLWGTLCLMLPEGAFKSTCIERFHIHNFFHFYSVAVNHKQKAKVHKSHRGLLLRDCEEFVICDVTNKNHFCVFFLQTQIAVIHCGTKFIKCLSPARKIDARISSDNCRQLLKRRKKLIDTFMVAEKLWLFRKFFYNNSKVASCTDNGRERVKNLWLATVFMAVLARRDTKCRSICTFSQINT